MSKSLIRSLRKIKPKIDRIPAKVKSFADLKKMDRMSNQDLVATAKVLAAQYRQTADPEAKRATGALIKYIYQLVEKRVESDGLQNRSPEADPDNTPKAGAA